jgi:hypothetical protein
LRSRVAWGYGGANGKNSEETDGVTGSLVVMAAQRTGPAMPLERMGPAMPSPAL